MRLVLLSIRSSKCSSPPVPPLYGLTNGDQSFPSDPPTHTPSHPPNPPRPPPRTHTPTPTRMHTHTGKVKKEQGGREREASQSLNGRASHIPLSSRACLEFQSARRSGLIWSACVSCVSSERQQGLAEGGGAPCEQPQAFTRESVQRHRGTKGERPRDSAASEACSRFFTPNPLSSPAALASPFKTLFNEPNSCRALCRDLTLPRPAPAALPTAAEPEIGLEIKNED